MPGFVIDTIRRYVVRDTGRPSLPELDYAYAGKRNRHPEVHSPPLREVGCPPLRVPRETNGDSNTQPEVTRVFPQSSLEIDR